MDGNNETQKGIETVKPGKDRIGDYVAMTELMAVGAKFFTMSGEPYAETPFASYKLENPSDPGFKRIE